MRKILRLSAVALLIAAAANAQKEKPAALEGNGNVVAKEYPVGSFESLKASGVYELRLAQGATESVKVEADENLQPYFSVHNEGRRLVIEMKNLKNKNLKLKNKLRVYVSFKTLKELDLSTVGSVKADAALQFADLSIKNKTVGGVELALSANSLNLANSSVGDVRLSGKAQTADFTNEGVGHLQAGGLVVQTMKIDNNGVGGAEVNVEKELKVTDNMLGRVKNRGAAPVRKNNRVEI